MGKKLNLGEIIKRLAIISPDIEILSTEYTNSATNIICKCKIDGNEWGATWNNLKKGKGCKVCSTKKNSDNQRFDIDIVKEKLKIINPNIRILSSEYVTNSTKLDCQCLIDNHMWSVNWANLSQGSGCPKCANNIQLTIDEVKLNVKNLNKGIVVLSGIYVNNKEKLQCKCDICDNMWDTRYDNLMSRYGCPKCGIEAISSSNSYRWVGGVSNLQEYLRSKISEWKNETMLACNYKCDITGGRFSIIHHMHGFDKIVMETMKNLKLPILKEINEYSKQELELIEVKCLELHFTYGLGVCLCKEEHDLFHSIYKRGNNTVKQYEEFKEIRLQEINKGDVKEIS